MKRIIPWNKEIAARLEKLDEILGRFNWSIPGGLDCKDLEWVQEKDRLAQWRFGKLYGGCIQIKDGNIFYGFYKDDREFGRLRKTYKARKWDPEEVMEKTGPGFLKECRGVLRRCTWYESRYYSSKGGLYEGECDYKWRADGRGEISW